MPIMETQAQLTCTSVVPERSRENIDFDDVAKACATPMEFLSTEKCSNKPHCPEKDDEDVFENDETDGKESNENENDENENHGTSFCRSTKVHGAIRLGSALLCMLMIVITLVIKLTHQLVPTVSLLANFWNGSCDWPPV